MIFEWLRTTSASSIAHSGYTIRHGSERPRLGRNTEVLSGPAFLNRFASLTHPALLGASFQVRAGEVAARPAANGSREVNSVANPGDAVGDELRSCLVRRRDAERRASQGTFLGSQKRTLSTSRAPSGIGAPCDLQAAR